MASLERHIANIQCLLTRIRAVEHNTSPKDALLHDLLLMEFRTEAELTCGNTSARSRRYASLRSSPARNATQRATLI